MKSRVKYYFSALTTGYLQIGVNVLYTLASIPLALHFLSAKQFALWQVAVSVAGYLMLVDFGLTDSMARILIDHKDNPRDGAYGSVIKIGIAVCSIQGLLVVLGGLAVSFWMPQLVNVHKQFSSPAEAEAAARALFFLTAGQCALQGIFFPARIFWNIVVAHQRYDLYNYTQVAVLICNFGALWVSFENGFGVYSILIASAAGSLFGFCGSWIIAWRCHFLPPTGCWGKFDVKQFKEIFFFGGNLFLIALGGQLINTSQILIISNLLGLEAAAVWAVATKPFMMAQQLVGRITAFACSPMSEMVVRNERERYFKRFRDLVIVSSSAAVVIGGAIALCNQSFLQVWLQNRPILSSIHATWNRWNDILLALWFITTCSTVNHVTAIGFVKQIGRMRYIYFFEGLIFVTLSILLAQPVGIAGIIVAAIVANILCSGIFGIRRTAIYFEMPVYRILTGWMSHPIFFAVVLAVLLTGIGLLVAPLTPLVKLIISSVISMAMGLPLFWRVGLTDELRKELLPLFSKAKDKLLGRFQPTR